jgi:CRP-like cAMP-binding protein
MEVDGAAVRYVEGNSLIDTLPPADRELLLPHLTVFEPEVPTCIVSRGGHFEDVLFPIGAVFSTTANLRLGHAYEVAITGRHGVIGAELALGVETSPRSVLTQIGGRAARMPRSDFLRSIAASRALLDAVQRYLLRRLFVAEQFVACNFAHATAERCARWILMLRDEVGRDEFELRAEFLGMMLGLPPKKAAAAGERLDSMGVVRYADEQLAIVDPETLSELACECYEAQREFAPA